MNNAAASDSEDDQAMLAVFSQSARLDRRWDAVMLSKPSARQKVQKPPPATKEGSSPMSKFCIAALCAFLLPSLTANAEVIRFEMLQSGAAFKGRSFGSVGPYVKITGRATIAVDPADPRNAIIADIDKAPRDEKGLVEATVDVVLLRPADPAPFLSTFPIAAQSSRRSCSTIQ